MLKLNKYKLNVNEVLAASKDAIYAVLPFSAEMDKISVDLDSFFFLLDTATTAKEDGDKLNWN